MGAFFSTPPPAPPSEKLEEPWRKVTWREKDQILTELEAFTSCSGVLRILLYGPTGAGRSSFVNSVQKVLLGRNFISAQEQALQRESITVTIKTHKMKKRGGRHYPFVFHDIMGLQPIDLGGIQTADIINVLEGHISDDYTFNHLRPITEDHPKYKANPTPADKVHCLVCILPADFVSRMDNKVFDKMRTIQKKAAELNIPQVIVLTRVDEACDMVKQDLTKIYQSKKIRKKVQECSNQLSISLNNIYPVQNYYAEITPDEATDVLILMALKDIVNFANDYVEDRDDI